MSRHSRASRDSSPFAQPLTYPGEPPSESGILLDNAYVPAERATMDELLGEFCVAPLTHRTSVLAVGSNASMAQLRRKLHATGRGRLVVPMTLSHVAGISPGVSAHVSRPGYVPATPILTPAHHSKLFLVWLDPDQLCVMDATEPNYVRIPLPTTRFPVTDASDGGRILTCDIYVSKHGCLLRPDGTERRLQPQPGLITSLLGESAALRALAGDSLESWLQTMRRPEARDQARKIWIREGRVHPPVLYDRP